MVGAPWIPVCHRSCSPPLHLDPSAPPPSTSESWAVQAGPRGYIQNLRILAPLLLEHSGTGFHPYTLYTVKVLGARSPL